MGELHHAHSFWQCKKVWCIIDHLLSLRKLALDDQRVAPLWPLLSWTSCVDPRRSFRPLPCRPATSYGRRSIESLACRCDLSQDSQELEALSFQGRFLSKFVPDRAGEQVLVFTGWLGVALGPE